MKKKIQKLYLLGLVLSSLNSMAQNQVYWKEGFEPSAGCDITTAPPTSPITGSHYNGGAGTWYVYGAYRSSGSASNNCSGVISTIGINHIRFSNVVSSPDSSYIVTPIVSAGIQEFHFMRTRASRNFTLWITSDTSAVGGTWTPITQVKSNANICGDTMVPINSSIAKRLKIVGRPGTDSDIDSVWLTSFGAILPVKFGAISASESNGLVKLNWNIETETNTNSYIVERSANGDNFGEVGTLKANHSANYIWMDNAANNGMNYYRIKALDNNGTYQYSTTIRINVGKIKGGLNVYPNPIKGGQINIELSGISKGNYSINVFNLNGALVYTSSLSSEGTSLSKTVTLPSNLTTGNYTLKISNGSFNSSKLITVL